MMAKQMSIIKNIDIGYFELKRKESLVIIGTQLGGANRQQSSVGFVCVEVLRPGQPSGVMSSAVSLPNHTFTGQA